MRSKRLFFFIGVLFFMLLACHKEYSANGAEQVKTDTLPASYPFANGFCDGVTLGIPIPDTNNYLPDTSNTLPALVILDMPAPGNQGSQGSCTAWATVYGVGSYYTHLKTGEPYNDTANLSPKYTYNQITKGNCTCTSFLDNLYLLKMQGASSLGIMPYDANECAQQPDSLQKNNAENYKISDWRKVNLHNLNVIKHAILEKKPVLFSINVDEGFRRLEAPFIWRVRIGSIGQPHAMVIVGYDNKKGFKIMNSWSTAWGENGFAWIEYDFFIKYVLEGGYLVI